MAKKLLARRNGTKVQFECRLSYVHLDKPYGRQGEKEKYSVTCLIPDDDTQTIAVLKEAIELAKEAGKQAKWDGIIPKKLGICLHCGVEESDKESLQGLHYMTASSYNEVPVFDRSREKIDPVNAYSGCYALVEVNFYPYNVSQKGVAAGLNQVLKLREGEKLKNDSAKCDAFAGFDDLEDDGDDF